MKLVENAQTIGPTSDSPVLDQSPVVSDMTLLESARAMDKDALVQIFDLYAASLYRYAIHLCQNSRLADQIVGDVFARLLDHLSAGHGPRSNLRSYLYQMTYHLVVDEMRYSNRRAPLDALDGIGYEDTALSTVEERLMFEKVMHTVRTTLSNDQQHVIILRFLEGMSLSEIARIMGKQVNHIKVLQNRGIKRLRRALEASEKLDVKPGAAEMNFSIARFEFAG